MPPALQKRMSEALKVYSNNRKSFQGLSMGGLSLYVAWTTYLGLTGGRKGQSQREEPETVEGTRSSAKKRRRRGREWFRTAHPSSTAVRGPILTW